MTYEEVKNIFVIEGKLFFNGNGKKGTSNYSVMYVWPGKKTKSMAQVTFFNGKVRGMH
jgi:hypothetical protein